MPVRRQYQPLGNVVTDKTGVRALNATYTNNTGQLLLIVLRIRLNHTDPNNGVECLAQLTGPGGLINIACAAFVGVVGSSSKRLEVTLTWVVPVGWDYGTSTSVVGTNTIDYLNWVETTIIAPFSAGF